MPGASVLAHGSHPLRFGVPPVWEAAARDRFPAGAPPRAADGSTHSLGCESAALGPGLPGEPGPAGPAPLRGDLHLIF